MFEISDETLRLINKTCKGKKHLKLTVGYLKDNDPVTKTFTVSLLSKYVSENKLLINDSIQKYIKEIKEDTYYPTLLRLATHSSGYSGSLPLNKREYFKIILGLIFGGSDLNKNNPLHMDFNKMKMLIESNKLKEVDYSWKYSNFGISLIGYVLGMVSGRSEWDTMNDFFHNELGLKDTCL